MDSLFYKADRHFASVFLQITHVISVSQVMMKRRKQVNTESQSNRNVQKYDTLKNPQTIASCI